MHSREKPEMLLVSTITICRNSKDTIKRCLDSILDQTYPNIQMVIVDSSDDGTEKIVRDYKKRSYFPFKLIRQDPKGVGIARNTGIKNSDGEVLIFVDADCYIEPDYVEKVVKPFTESDKVLSVYAEKIQVPPSGIFPRLVHLYERIMHYDVATDPYKMVGTSVVKSKIYDLIGLYDPNLKSGEDAELFSRLINKKESLQKEGYIFKNVLDARLYEEKQGLGFFEYYKRCIWYGKPLANRTYLKSDFHPNIIKVMLAFYCFSLPLLVIVRIIMNLNYQYFLIILVPLIMSSLYIIYKSLRFGMFCWLTFLMPLLIFYKFTGLFVGLMKGVLAKIAKFGERPKHVKI